MVPKTSTDEDIVGFSLTVVLIVLILKAYLHYTDINKEFISYKVSCDPVTLLQFTRIAYDIVFLKTVILFHFQGAVQLGVDFKFTDTVVLREP